MTRNGTQRKLRFLSTFEPATNFYRDLLPRLVRDGGDVQVVLSRTEYRGGRPRLRTALAGSGVKVTEAMGSGDRVSGTMSKLKAMAAFLASAITLTLFRPAGAINIFFSTPPFFALWGTALRALRKQPYVCIVQDVYPDVLVADGRLPANSPATRLLRSITHFVWRRADAVVVIGRCMHDLAVAAGVDESRIHIIHNWGHGTDDAPLPPGESDLRAETGLAGRFVVLYSGNLGLSHTFDEILRVAQDSQARGEDTVFVFIGDGSRRREVEAAKQDKQLDNIVLLPFQPTDRLRQSLALADVHLVTLRTGFEGVVVPSKAYGAMASGRPVIYVGEGHGEIALTIAEEQIGTVVAPGDVEGLAAAIARYRADREQRLAEGRRAAEVARGRFGRDSALDAWSQLLRNSDFSR